MGRAEFRSSLIPTNFHTEEVDDEAVEVNGTKYLVNCVSMGNPHCVVVKDHLDLDEIRKVGPMIEHYPMFPNRINVQFAQVVNRHEARILIWERGAGFTLASGTSSCAVACVLHKKGLVDNDVLIRCLGGDLKIQISRDWEVRMTGKIRQICSGVLDNELLEDFEK